MAGCDSKTPGGFGALATPASAGFSSFHTAASDASDATAAAAAAAASSLFASAWSHLNHAPFGFDGAIVPQASQSHFGLSLPSSLPSLPSLPSAQSTAAEGEARYPLQVMSVPCNEPASLPSNPSCNSCGTADGSARYDDDEEDDRAEDDDDRPDGGAEDYTHGPATANTTSGSGGSAGGGGEEGEDGKKRKRTNMSREERKREDMAAVSDRIDDALSDLASKLKAAMGEVVYYPMSDPAAVDGNGDGGRDVLKQYLPAGTATDATSLRKNRDPHVHYAFYESECLFITKEINKLAALQRYLVQQVRLYRYRLCNNCRKKWKGNVDLLKSTLSPYQQQQQQQMLIGSNANALNPHNTRTYRTHRDSKSNTIFTPTTTSTTTNTTLNPFAPSHTQATGQDGAELTPTVWTAGNETHTHVIPAVRKNGMPDPSWQRLGIVSVIHPKRSKRPKKNTTPPTPNTTTTAALHSKPINDAVDRAAAHGGHSHGGVKIEKDAVDVSLPPHVKLAPLGADGIHVIPKPPNPSLRPRFRAS